MQRDDNRNQHLKSYSIPKGLDQAIFQIPHDCDSGVPAKSFVELPKRPLKIHALAVPESLLAAPIAPHFLALDFEDLHGFG
jgi:hypothetical protein